MSEQIDIAVDLGVVPPPLPEIMSLRQLVEAAPAAPPQIIEGVLHQGCKMVLCEAVLGDKAREALNEEVEKQLKQKLADAKIRAAKEIEGKFSDQLKEMRESLIEKDNSIRAFRANELELRKQKQALEKDKEEFELQFQRKLDEERSTIRREAEGRVLEQHRLKDLEKDKVINDLKAALEDMKRKAALD